MRSFGLRIKILLGFATLALLFFGVVKIGEAIQFSHRTDITFDQFVKQRPKEGWFTIHGGILNAASAVYLKKKDSDAISEIYVPVEGSEKSDGKPIYLVVQTKDAGILDTYNTILGFGDNKKAFDDFSSKNSGRIFVLRDIEGMIQSGIDDDSKVKTKISDYLNQNANQVDPEFVVLEEGKQPSMASGIGLLLGGLILGALQALYYISRRGTRNTR